MSREDVEIVRRVFEEFQEAVERGDPGGWFESEAVADDFELMTDPSLEGRSVWRGREGFVEFVRTWTDEFEDWSIRVERLIDAGDDRVVVLTHQSATGKASGVPVEWKNGHVYELEAGCIVRVSHYLSHAEALEAAGLRE
jgi:ketosteroid isomerase-like protein